MTKVMLDTFLTEISPEEFEDTYSASYDNYLMDYEIAEKELHRIYKECLISKRQLKKKTIEDLVVGNGFLNDVSFDANKLTKNIDGIVDVIKFFCIEEDPFSEIGFLDCGTVGYDGEGELFPFVDPDAEKMVQLGTAIGELSILQMPGDFDTEGTLFAVSGKAASKDINKMHVKHF